MTTRSRTIGFMRRKGDRFRRVLPGKSLTEANIGSRRLANESRPLYFYSTAQSWSFFISEVEGARPSKGYPPNRIAMRAANIWGTKSRRLSSLAALAKMNVEPGQNTAARTCSQTAFINLTARDYFGGW